MKNVTCEMLDRGAMIKMGYSSCVDGIIRQSLFMKALNKRIKELQEKGNEIVSVGFVTGAYADIRALITFGTVK